jgi:ATP-binding protein involved in chromosome partitioning
MISKEMVLERLSHVKGPDLKGDIVSQKLVSDIVITGGKVVFSINVPAERAAELEPLREAAEKSVSLLDGVSQVTAVLTAERRSAAAPSSPVQGMAQGRGAPRQPGGAHQAAIQVPGVAAIIAVASGKGGVGKSTTAVNLALALHRLGLRVGILDADIYGPSMPRLLGTSERPYKDGDKLMPNEAYGVKAMSMGFLVDEETPMIWRGPMVISALTQMLRDVNWGELDVMVVDMPPGTGDAQLTMAQQVPLAGAIIVSTPQDIALIDARKGLNMFRKVNVPILGLIENMSYFLCPKCGERSDIFGHGGARAEAERLGAPFLGEVPLHMDIRLHSDSGTPIVVSQPDSAHAKVYMEIAQRTVERMEAESSQTANAAPKIIIE